MAAANKLIKIALTNVILLILFYVVFLGFSILFDHIFWLIFTGYKITDIPTIKGLGITLVYSLFYYFLAYIIIFFVIVLLGNLSIFYLNRFFTIQNNKLKWALLFGVLFLLFPWLLKLILRMDYDNVGGYMEEYRTIKYFLTYFFIGFTYGYVYYRTLKKYGLLLPAFSGKENNEHARKGIIN